MTLRLPKVKTGLPGRQCVPTALRQDQSALTAHVLHRARRARPIVAAPPACAPRSDDDLLGSSLASCSAYNACGNAACAGPSGRGVAWAGAHVLAQWGLTAARRRGGVACAAAKGGSKAAGGGGGGGGAGGGGSGGKGGAKRGDGGGGSGPGKGAADDKADPAKADFSAYWSLRFREFFSGRRQYLELTRKQQEPPEVMRKLDAQIALQKERLEQATQNKRDYKRARYQAEVLDEANAVLDYTQLTQEDLDEMAREHAEGRRPTNVDRINADIDAARDHLRSRGVKAAAIPAMQLRAAAAALAAAPLALPAAALARWRALFSGPRYEAFLLSEGERVWYWRNRTENERWFWEVFFLDRLVIPTAWILGYLYIVPNNLIWAVLVPLVTLTWQDGRLPGPFNLEWWLIMVFGLYGKCWHQVTAALAFVLQWW